MHALSAFNTQLFDFLDQSPTPFHACNQIVAILERNGFQRLDEKHPWSVTHPGKYFIIRNQSSLIAFNLADHKKITDGFHIIGAHTDSPGLHIKPNAEKIFKNHLQSNVEVYGGPLLNTWFDRELSIAGRLSILNTQNRIEHRLVDFQRPMAIIPSLAIHLDREANEKKSVQKQKDLPPLMAQFQPPHKPHFKTILQEEFCPDAKEVLDYELMFYDPHKASFFGLENEFFASSRIDNLLSCFTGLQALLESNKKMNTMLVCQDHEECGSSSRIGADGSMLSSLLQRLAGNYESYALLIANSWLVSCDNAHAIHPNFPEKSDDDHAPLLNAGPAIKINHNQRYATTGETSAQFLHWAKQAESPVQLFVSRSDIPCGSTIGPISSAHTGIKTIDVGVPTLGMHSVRETAGVWDAYHLHNILISYFNNQDTQEKD